MSDRSSPPVDILDAATIDRMIDAHFPEIHHGGKTLYIEALTDGAAKVRLKSHPKNLRPGGTVSGPALFTLADYGVYVAILAKLGERALQAVTTSMTLNFLRRPPAGDVVADIKLIKVGRRLIVADIAMQAEGVEGMVAHSVATYALP